MTGTDITTTDRPGQVDLRQQVQAMEHQFALAAPKGIEARQIVRDVLTAIRQNPKLLECDPQSVLGGAMTMAQLGLRPNVLGHGWLVPFWDNRARMYKAQLIIGYQGFAELAHRSGHIKSMSMRTVHANDHFEIEYGVDEKLIHRPATGDRGEVTGYYAVARYLPAGHSFYYLTKQEAEIHRDRYAMARTKGGKIVGPWVDHFDGMSLKTCIRMMAKLMPKGTDILAIGLAADESVRIDVSPTASPETVSMPVIREQQEPTESVQISDEPEPQDEEQDTPVPAGTGWQEAYADLSHAAQQRGYTERQMRVLLEQEHAQPVEDLTVEQLTATIEVINRTDPADIASGDEA